MDLLDRAEVRLLIALGIGMLIGAERERRKAETGSGAAGIRTFAFTALMGGLSGYFQHVAVLVAGLVVAGALAIAGYMHAGDEDRGLTSEVALVVSYLLGAVAMKHPVLAPAASVCVATILALRTRMHALVKEALTTQELMDGLLFGIAALVILPLVPDRAIGPYGVLNPFTVWRLVVVVMAITGAGYVAQRIVGPRYGLPIAGLASGFVSSSATIAAMGGRAKADEKMMKPAVAGAACSSIATIVQLAIVVGAASKETLRALTLPLALAGVTAAVYGGFFALQAAKQKGTATSPKGHAFEMKSAVIFAVAVSVVVLGSTAIHKNFGDAGLFVAAGAAGFADAHSSSASVASVQGAGAITARAASLGVLIAMSTNSLTKMGLAFSSGPRAYAVRVVVGVVLVQAAAWGGLLLTR
jgi:uncharacterized membrane protein (DUF4010 family)